MNLPEVWSRNSYDVEAVQITVDNIHTVSSWCGGTVRRAMRSGPNHRYIELYALERRTGKYHLVTMLPGDWLVRTNTWFEKFDDGVFQAEHSSPTQNDLEVRQTKLAIRGIIHQELARVFQTEVMYQTGWSRKGFSVTETYFDAVLDKENRPLFNGTEEDTVKWCEDNPSDLPRWVCIGKTMDIVTESEYIDLHEGKK